MGLERGKSRAGLWGGAQRSGASESEQFDLLVLACRRGLPGGFFVQRFRAVEVACDDLDAPVEVLFEQLHRALDVPVFDGPQQRPMVFLGDFTQAHGFEVEAQLSLIHI